MWELFEGYRKETKTNPRKRMVFVGKDGIKDYEELEVPLTLEGFRLYCYDRVGVVHHYFQNTDNMYDDFWGVCSRIKETVRQDQIAGGMVGQYNASITQRLNGLVDKTEVDVKTEPRVFNINPDSE